MATRYQLRGLVDRITSCDTSTPSEVSIVDQVRLVYNDFGQLTADYQAHYGAVDMGSTPKVGYTYADGSAPVPLIYYPN
jgi:hypothetical protein